MTTEHKTPEPWQYHIHGDRDLENYLIFRGDWDGTLEWVITTPFCSSHDEANARRIVACVNACRAFSTEDLEQDPEYVLWNHYGSPT